MASKTLKRKLKAERLGELWLVKPPQKMWIGRKGVKLVAVVALSLRKKGGRGAGVQNVEAQE